ncbi:MAG TPA: hypothetical protein GX708_02365 [Gallicola sp.]|nr:hypothetical protein [Gallicola sp.]
MNKKVLSEFTFGDVSRMVKTAYKMADKGRIYIQLEDIYSNNPMMYLSRSEKHQGGGRVTWGYVQQEHDVYAEIFTNKEDEYYSKDTFCNRLYDYIKERY